MEVVCPINVPREPASRGLVPPLGPSVAQSETAVAQCSNAARVSHRSPAAVRAYPTSVALVDACHSPARSRVPTAVQWQTVAAVCSIVAPVRRDRPAVAMGFQVSAVAALRSRCLPASPRPGSGRGSLGCELRLVPSTESLVTPIPRCAPFARSRVTASATEVREYATVHAPDVFGVRSDVHHARFSLRLSGGLRRTTTATAATPCP